MNEHSVAVGVPILQPLRLLPFAEDAAILGRDADIDKTFIESGTVEEAYVETDADVQPFDEQRAIETLQIAGTAPEPAGGERPTPARLERHSDVGGLSADDGIARGSARPPLFPLPIPVRSANPRDGNA